MSFKESSRWAKPKVEAERSAMAAQLKDMIQRDGAEAVESFLQRTIGHLEGDATPEGQLRRFLAILELLSLHETTGTLSSGNLAQLREMGEAILKTQGIYAGTSRLSYLYGDLLASFARIRYKEGRHWPYIWQTQLALFLSKSESGESGEQALATGHAAFRRGNLSSALEAYGVAETLGLSPESTESCRLARIAALRLSGRPEEAAVLATETQLLATLSDVAKLQIEWESLCRDVQRHGELGKMISATNRTGDHREAQYILEATLWAKAVPSKQYLTRLPKAESIRKAFSDSLKRPSANAQLYECVLQLERCYDNDIPLLKRVTDLGEMLDRVPKMQRLDHELLVWACAARWLMRFHQPQMATFVLNEYRALSLRITDGTLGDCLAVTADLDVKAWAKVDEKAKDVVVGEQTTLARIKTSRLSRAAEMTKLAVNVSGVMLKGKIKGIGRDAVSKERIFLEHRAEIVSMAVEAIGRLKGPLVKAGQVLSFAMSDLPEDLKRAIEGLRDSTAPLETHQVKAQIETEFGKKVEELFAEFDEQPLAAASIGQIHAARLHDGREVVVKVQYPSIQDIIVSDFSLIRMLKPLYKLYFPNANVEEVMEYSYLKLLDECDYLREAANQTHARKLYENDPGVVIPEVIHSHTGRTVITMERIFGVRFGEFVATASQAERDRAGVTIYRFGWDGFLKHGFLNGDQHPGNFLFLPDGRVAFLDFGYANALSKPRVTLWKNLFKSVLESDFEAFKGVLPKMDFIVETEPFDFAEAWAQAHSSMTAVLRDENVTFSKALVSYNVENVTIRSNNRNAIRLPLDDVMYLRFAWCLQGLMSELGANANWSRILRPMLYETSDSKTSNAS